LHASNYLSIDIETNNIHLDDMIPSFYRFLLFLYTMVLLKLLTYSGL